jgi:ATP-binding cassette subfamily B protein
VKIKKWHKLVSYYKPYKFLFFLDIFCSILIAVISVIIPLIIKFLTNKVMSWEKNKALKMALICLVIVIVLVLILYLCNFIMTYYGHLLGTKMEKDMRDELFEHFQKLSLNFYENKKIGELMSRIVVDLENLNEFLHHFPEEMIVIIIRLVLVFIILFTIKPFLMFIALIITSFTIFYVIFLTPKINKLAKDNKKKISEINNQLNDSLSGVQVVKSFTNEELEIKKFKNSSMIFVESRKRYLKQVGILFAYMNSFIIFLVPIFAILGIYLVINDLMSISDVITFILYSDILITPFFSILGIYEIMNHAMAGFSRFIEALEVKPDILDKNHAKILQKVNGDITFKNVGFKYENSSKNVLKNINLEIRSKEYVALVGPSGVGKSTICNLIPRFYDATQGEILIDGINIKDVTQKSLRENIGMVQQDIYLFAGTVKENIVYGKLNASEEEIIKAAKAAYAHDFIMKFPKGYDTYIGQRGIKLSGGQKQRLSITRVFLKNPKILILDEATSALDNESERFIQKSLETLSQKRTTLVIAHRLSTVRMAKRIIVLTEEGIVEQGIHDTLLKKQGVYARLYNMQF